MDVLTELKEKILTEADQAIYEGILSETKRTGELNAKHERVLFEILGRATEAPKKKTRVKDAPASEEK